MSRAALRKRRRWPMDPQCLQLTERPSSTGPSRCACMEAGPFKKCPFAKPNPWNLLVSLHHLEHVGNLVECDGFKSYFYLDVDDYS